MRNAVWVVVCGLLLMAGGAEAFTGDRFNTGSQKKMTENNMRIQTEACRAKAGKDQKAWRECPTKVREQYQKKLERKGKDARIQPGVTVK